MSWRDHFHSSCTPRRAVRSARATCKSRSISQNRQDRFRYASLSRARAHFNETHFTMHTARALGERKKEEEGKREQEETQLSFREIRSPRGIVCRFPVKSPFQAVSDIRSILRARFSSRQYVRLS